MTAAIRLIIHGRVQGVGYRAWTCGRARALQLTGWVRNRADGTVEAVFCGEREAVAAMRADCSHGPIAARVRRIEETPWDGEPPEDFRQMQTV